MLDRRPRGLGPFRAVIRIFLRNAFAPPAHSIGLDTHQQDAAAVNPAKARFKKMHERHVDFTQSYGFDFHNELWFVSGHRFSDTINPPACRDGACPVSSGRGGGRGKPLLYRESGPPARTGHFRPRRAHSQAPSVLRQTPAGTAHDSFPARLAPAYASSRRPSIRRSPLAHRYARDIRTAPSEHPPAPLRPALTSSTTPPPVGRWADHPAMATM